MINLFHATDDFCDICKHYATKKTNVSPNLLPHCSSPSFHFELNTLQPAGLCQPCCSMACTGLQASKTQAFFSLREVGLFPLSLIHVHGNGSYLVFACMAINKSRLHAERGGYMGVFWHYSACNKDICTWIRSPLKKKDTLLLYLHSMDVHALAIRSLCSWMGLAP